MSRATRIAVIAIAALPPLYMAAALVGALLPANPGWVQPSDGITVFVSTNGVHTALVVPVVTAGVDWRGLVRPEHLPAAARMADHLAFGWGDRNFYLHTPTWADLTVEAAARALLLPGAALIHVHLLRRPQPSADQRQLRLTPAQYRRLSGYIRDSFGLTASGAAIPLPAHSTDALFYEAQGSWSALRTSNEWTGAALRRAGVRTGVWTPFAWSVMWRFDGDSHPQ